MQNNPIWINRLKGVGYISPEDAIALGVSGPPLRAAGIDFDVRRDMPYSELREVSVQCADLDCRAMCGLDMSSACRRCASR